MEYFFARLERKSIRSIATGVFYFEASRKKKRFIGWF